MQKKRGGGKSTQEKICDRQGSPRHHFDSRNPFLFFLGLKVSLPWLHLAVNVTGGTRDQGF